MTTAADRIARTLNDLLARVEQLERAPRLTHASIEGEPLDVFDDDGTLRQTVGLQTDGTYTLIDVNGPPPPMPSQPIVEARPGALVVTWDGAFAGGEAAPLDFAHVEVHVSTVPGYTPTDATEVTTVHSLKGGSVTLALDPVAHYVVLQAVSTSGTESDPTPEVAATPQPPATGAGGVQTFATDEPPIGLDLGDDGALWFDTNDGNKEYRWDGSAWVSIRDAGITQAQATADAALAAATTDSTAPSASPTPTMIGGWGAFYLKWDPVANADPVIYDAYLSTVSGFTPDEFTLAADDLTSPWVTLRVDAAGNELAYGTTYYARIVARDADGAAAAGGEASDTLAPIGDSDISAEYAYLGNIFVEQLQGGTLLADVILSAAIATGPAGTKRTVQDGFGFRQEVPTGDPDGGVSVVVNLPNDGDADFRGHINAQSATVEGGLEIRGQDNILAVGSKLTLAAGIQGSATPPTLAPGFPRVTADATVSPPDGYFAALGDRWSVSFKSMGSQGAVVRGYQLVRKVGAAPELTYDLGNISWSGGLVTVFDATSGEQRLFVLGRPVIPGGFGSWKVYEYDYTSWPPTLLHSHDWVPASLPAGPYKPAIGPVSSGGYCSAMHHTDGRIVLRRYNADGVHQETVLVPEQPEFDAGLVDIYGVAFGTFDVGGSRWAVALRDRVVFFDNSGVRDFNLTFYTDGDISAFSASLGGAGAFERFETISADGATRTRYTGQHLGDNVAAADFTWWLGFTWNDNIGTLHETTVSALASVTVPKRGSVTAQTPEIPAGGVDDPNSIKIYAARSIPEPAASALRMQIAPANGVTVKTYEALTSGGVAPPVTNTFTTGAAGRVVEAQSGQAKFGLSNDGSGEWTYLMPPGAMVGYGGVGDPPGWLICDGRAISRTAPAYVSLFAAIGTTFGAGDGTTFNIPDMRDRFPYGAGERTPGTNDTDPFGFARTNRLLHTHSHGDGTLTTDPTSTTNAVQSGTGSTRAFSTHVHTVSGETANSTLPVHAYLSRNEIIKL